MRRQISAPGRLACGWHDSLRPRLWARANRIGRWPMASTTAADIVESVGGPANIDSLSYCATRLRFQLGDASGVTQSDIEAIAGVMGAVPQAGNRYQIVIGGAVQIRLQRHHGAARDGQPEHRRRRRRHQGRRPRPGTPRQVRVAGQFLRVPVRFVPADSGRAAGRFAVHHLHVTDEHPGCHPELGRPAHRTVAVVAVRQPVLAVRFRLPAADDRLQRVEEAQRGSRGSVSRSWRSSCSRVSPLSETSPSR